MDRWPSQTALVIATALLAGIFSLRSAISAGSRFGYGVALSDGSESSQLGRIRRADDERERVSVLPRYVIAAIGFGIACALFAQVIPPSIAYAILCVALVVRPIADQLAEERAPRRRSALLGRSRRIDPVLATWIGVAAVSPLSLIPWVIDEASRTAAIVVAACVVAIVVVAWRIASAPLLLFGNDLKAEQAVDRETRTVRTGNTCSIAVAAVSVYTGFAAGAPPFVYYRVDLSGTLLVAAAGILAWKAIYARHLSRTSLAP